MKGLVYIVLTLALVACSHSGATAMETLSDTIVAPGPQIPEPEPVPLDPMSQKLDSMGFVNVVDVDPAIQVNLMYATDSNFVGCNMYGDFRRAYLHPDAAEALAKASAALHKLHPDYNLLVKDASRPMSVQKTMYDVVRGTAKARYVSNPANGGGMHNYGVAVDITIVDSAGNELPMGTPVDFLGPEAGIKAERWLVQSGKITEEERLNRELLRQVMAAGGFKPLYSEWWHFNLVSRAVARQKYPLLNF